MVGARGELDCDGGGCPELLLGTHLLEQAGPPRSRLSVAGRDPTELCDPQELVTRTAGLAVAHVDRAVSRAQLHPGCPKGLKRARFRDAPGYSRVSKVQVRSEGVNHFLSLPRHVQQAARGQIPDFVLVDEAAFVNPSALLSLFPLLAVKNRKQIHISSHIPKSWVNKVGSIMDSDGKPAFHVINQRFKCDGHAQLPGLMCPCSAVFCPTHIDLNTSIQQLINNVAPGGAEMECAGGDVTGNALKSDTAQPFTEELVREFLSNTVVKPDRVLRYFVAMDPTYANGTQSSLGVCTFAELHNGTFVVSFDNHFIFQ
uniref:Polyprotein n=1 Tax=Latid herpesvirus 1 TaxID=3096545 RepID=A0AB33V6V3_9VIRU